jgi:hypothetical protein
VTLPRRLVLGCGLALVAALLLPHVVFVDEQGRTWLTDGDPPAAPGVQLSPEELRLRWGGKLEGEPLGRASSSRDEDRYLRELRAAEADLARGEIREGLQRLRRLVAAQPQRPEASWLLAQAERRRGRLEAARDVLVAMLGWISPGAERWRDAASGLLEEIDAELALAQAGLDGAEEREIATENFRILYDHRFAARDWGEQVAALLESARSDVQRLLGRGLERPLDVHLYTRGAYLESYKHRFGFATVGFYDGAIHVVAARQPRAELAALLAHEYVHAVFRDALGSDRPFFLNEGLADREEERLRGRSRLARGEWRKLLDAIRAEHWIPLASIVRSFAGLEGERALLAYLESRAAVELIEERRRGSLARWLERCAAGDGWESALRETTGFDVAGLDRALQRDVLDRFPRDPLAGVADATSE